MASTVYAIFKQRLRLLLGSILTQVSKFLMRTFFFIIAQKKRVEKSYQCIIPFAEIPFPFDRTYTHAHIRKQRERNRENNQHHHRYICRIRWLNKR